MRHNHKIYKQEGDPSKKDEREGGFNVYFSGANK